MFFRKPGKLAGTTEDVWVGIVMRRTHCSRAEAHLEVAAMIADGRLVPSAT